MKPRLFLPIALLLMICATVQAQSVGALTIFSEGGEKFYLILDGLKQNQEARTNVRVDGLTHPNYNVKIIFESQSLPEISKNYLMIADANQVMMDVTYRIKHDKNGMPKLGMMPTSFVPYQQATTAPQEVYVVHYGQPEPVSTSVSQTTVTTTTAAPTGTAVNINANGMNGGVTITNPNMTGTTVQTTTTTTTTTSDIPHEGIPAATPVARYGCAGADRMAEGDFSSALSTIQNQGFEESKLSTAKQIAGGNCLSAGQIADICKAFGFEETKLAFAKFAYKRCTEPQNYFKVNNVFGFSSSVDDLNAFIQSKR